MNSYLCLELPILSTGIDIDETIKGGLLLYINALQGELKEIFLADFESSIKLFLENKNHYGLQMAYGIDPKKTYITSTRYRQSKKGVEEMIEDVQSKQIAPTLRIQDRMTPQGRQSENEQLHITGRMDEENTFIIPEIGVFHNPVMEEIPFSIGINDTEVPETTFGVYSDDVNYGPPAEEMFSVPLIVGQEDAQTQEPEEPKKEIQNIVSISELGADEDMDSCDGKTSDI